MTQETTTSGEKSFATLQAQFALRGHRLYRCWRDGTPIYVAERWGLTKDLGSLEDVQRFLVQIGGER